jgi:hypothetical protein
VSARPARGRRVDPYRRRAQHSAISSTSPEGRHATAAIRQPAYTG